MNIFATDPDPIKSAQALDLKRVVKMILESYQLMSNALAKNGFEPFYKLSHVNHPCSIWAAQSPANYLWLLEHAQALCQVYTAYYSKVHKCETDRHWIAYDGYMAFAEKVKAPATPHVNCTEFKHVPDVHLAYKMQMLKKWDNDKLRPKWPAGIDPVALTLDWRNEIAAKTN